MVQFSKLNSTGWLLSRLRSLKAMEQNYAAVVMHLENVGSGQSPDVKEDDAAKAKGLLVEMQTVRFVRFLNFMIDYSTLLSECSKNLQYEDIFITCVKQMIESTTSKLLKLKIQPGKYTQSINNLLSGDASFFLYVPFNILSSFCTLNTYPDRTVDKYNT